MPELKIKKLPEIISRNGFEYRLHNRTEKKAIYSQHFKKRKIIAYEVFKIKLSNPYPFSDSDFDKIEYFPSNESFGKFAWTYKTLDEAYKRFNII